MSTNDQCPEGSPAADLTKPQRRLALWLLAQVDENGYTCHTPSEMTHVLKGHDGPPERVYGDCRPLYAALTALCQAGIAGFTWTPLTDGTEWAQFVTVAFMAWPQQVTA